MKPSYRPEIDGLRAIAVGVVILYHAQITILGHQPFKGGFIGVDIFFVISGYLITSIILKELITTGTFSFKHFYERRIRRILPVLLFVMLVSLPFAWIYLLSSSFVDFSKSILYSLGFSSNFYFHYSGQEYGAESGLFKPFLHTWSLSVEEQFYILFPIVLLITFKYFRKYLIHTLILGFAISLGLADWGSRNHPSFNFYVLPTRGWELLAGSILAYFEIINGQRSKNQTLNLILPTIGLLLIGYSILFFNNEMFHPSFYTLSPIIGVCLIIWFSNKNELITKILSTKLFVGVGLISYSLYLWHFPVFSFARIINFTEGNLFNKILLGLVILIMSIFSYYIIEKPARDKDNKFNVIISVIIILILFLIITNSKIILENGYKKRLPILLQSELHKETYSLLKNSEGKICFDNECKFNIISNKKVYIIGDSHMGSIMHDLKDKVIKKNYQFITSTFTGCFFYPGFNQIHTKTKKVDTNCNDNYFQKLKQNLSKQRNSIIIFGGRLPLYLSGNFFNNREGGVEQSKKWYFNYAPVKSSKYDSIEDSINNELLELSKHNKIILIYPIPEVGWHVSKKILKNRKIFTQKLDFKEITTSFDVYEDRTKSSFDLLDSIQSENIYRVYPHTLFCNTIIKNRCVTHDDKNIFYADDHHPSSKGAEMINDLIMKEIEKIKLNSN